MARCNSCFGIITKTDLKCYVCGDIVTESERMNLWSALLRAWAKVTAPPVDSETVARIRGWNHLNKIQRESSFRENSPVK